MSVVLCACWVRHPLFKHLGRLFGRAFEGSSFVWAWLVLTWLIRPGALEGVHVFCDVWSCGGALARLRFESFGTIGSASGREDRRWLRGGAFAGLAPDHFGFEAAVRHSERAWCSRAGFMLAWGVPPH